jgi:gliding motility-associated-like protein
VPDSTIVTIEEAPIVTADYTRPLCDTKPFQLTSASTNGVAYSWTGPNFTSNDQNPLIAVSSPANTGIYTLTVSSAKGCLSLPVSITATINPLPQPAFTDTNTCLPSTTAFFYNVSTIASGSITSYTFTKPGNYTITLTATSDRGCMASASNIFNRFHTKPKAEFSFSPADNLCVNDSIALTDGSNGADGNLVSWRWNLGDGTSIANNTNIAVTHRYQAAGNYRLSLFVTNSFSCGDTLQKQIIVYPLPIVDAGERQYILLGNSTLLNPTASGNGITYLWTPTTYINNNQIPAAVVVRPGDDILYTLTVTSIQQCKASDTVFIKVLKPLQIPNAFSPNGDGINDVWNVKYLADYPGAVVDIFDRYGRIVFHTVGYNKPWDGQRGGAPVPVGVYYYIITPKNGAAIVTGSLTVVR